MHQQGTRGGSGVAAAEGNQVQLQIVDLHDCFRNGLGKAKRSCSGRIVRVSTDAANRSRRRLAQSWTSVSGAGPGRDCYRFVARKPAQVDVGRSVDQPGLHATGAGQFDQPLAVRAVPAADDQNHVRFGRQQAHRLLPVLGGVADVRLRRSDDAGKPLPQAFDDPCRVVDRQGGLREISHFGQVGHSHSIGVRHALDQPDRLRHFARRAYHLIMARMADQ